MSVNSVWQKIRDFPQNTVCEFHLRRNIKRRSKVAAREAVAAGEAW
jgi:hypothetical protein